MWSGFWKFISNASTAWGLLPAHVAAALTGTVWLAVMTAAGYFEKVQLFWLLAAIPVVAASIATFMLRVSEWRERVSAAAKLQFHGFILRGDYEVQNGTPVMKAAQMQVVLTSKASFPISFKFEELRTSFAGRYAPNKRRNDDGGIALQHELKTFTDNSFEMNNMPVIGPQLGTASFRVRYGHPGREKYLIEENLKFEAVVGDDGKYHIVHHGPAREPL
jgi:hypothetical protein